MIKLRSKIQDGVVGIKEFDKWIPDKEKLDSGKGKKIWLINPNNKKTCGWFKYVKKTFNRDNKENEILTFENVSEKIAELIARELKINCAKIDIGTYYGDSGCLSYNILGDRQVMSEGVAYISRTYPKYDVQKGIDLETGKYYSLEIILESLKEKELKEEFFKIMIFDFIIGNSDRHPNNWAIVKNKSGKESLAPLYDNGSSLCALISDIELDKYFGNDKLKFLSLVDSKSKTLIRIDSRDKKIPTHKEVLEYLCKNYYIQTKEFAEAVIKKLNEEKIENILRGVNKYICHRRYELLKKYLMEKIRILKEIYERGG